MKMPSPIRIDDLGLTSISERGVAFKTGKPVEFRYWRNTEKSPTYGSRFQQDIEPAGRYMIHAQQEGTPIWLEEGIVRFEKPIVIRITDDTDNLYGPSSWKAKLHARFKGKGKALSKKLAKAGYDGIVTVSKHRQSSYTSEIVDLTMFTRKSNPILAKPPIQMHSLQGTGGDYFRRIVGRSPMPEDYYGVHTTGDYGVAMGYAEGAVQKESDPGAYPVVVSICVDGLQELPDVDAIVKATEASQALRRDGGDDVFDESESFEFDEEGNVIGEDPYYVYIGNIQEGGNLAGAFINVSEDPQEAWDEWKRTGIIPTEVATNLVDQRRFQTDIGIDRVVRVDAIQPMFREILESWWDSGDEDEESRAKRIESAGYAVATFEDVVVGHSLPNNRKSIYDGSVKCGRVEYHGTSSTRLGLAFPNMPIPPTPFPVTEVEEVMENPTLTPKDKKVIDAFVGRKKLSGKVLESDGRTLSRSFGSEDVANWMGDRIVEVSTESTKLDQTILRYLNRKAKAERVKVVSGYGQPLYSKGLHFFVDGDSMYPGQWDAVILAYVPGRDKPVGYLSFSTYAGRASVKMVEVAPEFKRHGVATALHRHLLKSQGLKASDIDRGMQTDEGHAFRKAMDPYFVEN